jgi:hypothetical protein
VGWGGGVVGGWGGGGGGGGGGVVGGGGGGKYTSKDISVMPFSLSASAANSSVENSMVARSVPAVLGCYTRRRDLKGSRAWMDGCFAGA